MGFDSAAPGGSFLKIGVGQADCTGCADSYDHFRLYAHAPALRAWTAHFDHEFVDSLTSFIQAVAGSAIVYAQDAAAAARHSRKCFIEPSLLINIGQQAHRHRASMTTIS